MTDSILEQVRNQVADHMTSILALFKPGARITVIVRTPTNDRADFLMSNDNLTSVAALIERRRAGKP